MYRLLCYIFILSQISFVHCEHPEQLSEVDGTKNNCISTYIKHHKVALCIGLCVLLFCSTLSVINTSVPGKKRVKIHKKWAPSWIRKDWTELGDADRGMFASTFKISSKDIYDIRIAHEVYKVPSILDGFIYTKQEHGRIIEDGRYEDIPYNMFEQILEKLKRAPNTFLKMLNPWTSGTTSWTEFNTCHVIFDLASICFFIDIGYNLITNKPELVELIYNKYCSNRDCFTLKN